jgi:hypothetical protein
MLIMPQTHKHQANSNAKSLSIRSCTIALRRLGAQQWILAALHWMHCAWSLAESQKCHIENRNIRLISYCVLFFLAGKVADVPVAVNEIKLLPKPALSLFYMVVHELKDARMTPITHEVMSRD